MDGLVTKALDNDVYLVVIVPAFVGVCVCPNPLLPSHHHHHLIILKHSHTLTHAHIYYNMPV